MSDSIGLKIETRSHFMKVKSVCVRDREREQDHSIKHFSVGHCQCLRNIALSHRRVRSKRHIFIIYPSTLTYIISEYVKNLHADKNTWYYCHHRVRRPRHLNIDLRDRFWLRSLFWLNTGIKIDSNWFKIRIQIQIQLDCKILHYLNECFLSQCKRVCVYHKGFKKFCKVVFNL